MRRAPRRASEVLDAAIGLGLLGGEDQARILEEHRGVEEFLGRPVSDSHVLYHRRWLTEEELEQATRAARRRTMFCPGCSARMNVFAAKAPIRCRDCNRSLSIPSDPGADMLVEGDAAAPGDDLARALSGLGIHRIAAAGEGSGGVVLRVELRPSGRTAALKLLHEDLQEEPALVRRFLREATAASGVRHAHIACPRHAGSIGGRSFLLMDWIEGRTLLDVVISEGPFPPARAVGSARDAAHGLQALHEAGLVHRDVKPANMVLRPNGEICVVDLGLVRSIRPGGQSWVTMTGDVLGTLCYMAPEQMVDPRRATPASDVYGLGASIIHLLDGSPPFEGMSGVDLAMALRRGETARLDRSCGAPRALADLVDRMTSSDPGHRPASAAEVAEALGRM